MLVCLRAYVQTLALHSVRNLASATRDLCDSATCTRRAKRGRSPPCVEEHILLGF